jgi:hypothetical protein
MARTGPQKRVLKPKTADVKAAAARAAARSEGKPIPPKRPEAKIDPIIVTHEKIIEEAVTRIEAKTRAVAIARRRQGGYTRPLGRAIAKMMVKGLTINRIGKRPRMPPASTIYTWVGTPNHPFLEHYARARESYYSRMAEDIVDLADDSGSDWKIETRGKDATPVKVLDREALERTKLRIETRKWLLSKALPHLYGDQVGKGDDAGQDAGTGEPRDVTPARDAPKSTGNDHLAHVAQRYGLGNRRAVPPSKEPVTIEGKSSRH